PASRTPSRRSSLSTAEGVVERVDGELVRIVGDSVTALRHSVPADFPLSLLLGRRIRVTLLNVADIDGLTQTLTITGADRHPLLIAHSGQVRGITHRLAALDVYVALSQRDGGPMVFGTARLRSIVRVGDHVRVRDGDETYVLQFESRSGSSATYALGLEDLWNGPPSTLR
ncbi:MAG TPA: hypothetical protein VGI39_08830, partial [Polyangiaceae bacterium]